MKSIKSKRLTDAAPSPLATKIQNDKKIALVLHQPFRFGQRLVAGIVHYASEHPNWEIVTPYLNTQITQVLENADTIDGVITMLFDHDTLDRPIMKGIPVVECSNTVHKASLAQVYSDEAAIGRLAAQHLLEKGLVNYAFCGYSCHKYSIERGEAFKEALALRGFNLAGNFTGSWTCKKGDAFVIGALKDWVGSLPRPIAVFCCNDVRALHLYQASKQAGLRVPADIAILGVDNEKDMLALYGLEISSIEQNVETIGWEAARLLDELMSGTPSTVVPKLISPIGVIPRGSTDLTQASDPIVARAMDLIRGRALSNFNVKDLINILGISRRCLERRFQASVGISPNDEITRVRLDRARELLVNTDMNINEVADAIGFSEQRQLTRLFRTQLKITPLRFRAQNKGK